MGQWDIAIEALVAVNDESSTQTRPVRPRNRWSGVGPSHPRVRGLDLLTNPYGLVRNGRAVNRASTVLDSSVIETHQL